METIESLRSRLREGCVIPAHPLALTPNGRLSERHQRALTKYYAAAGAGGIAVGVPTTQFEIREVGLYRPVLELAADVLGTTGPPGMNLIRIAGVVGNRKQAVAEAAIARDLGFEAGLLSLSAFADADDDALIEHCRAVAETIPLFGFYLQPAVGGRLLSYEFWSRFMEIPDVVAVKVSPFNRYQSLDVVRALAESGRADEISLYTGNDDSILIDLLTEYEFGIAGTAVRVGIRGGLLGHWSYWTKKAVEHLRRCKEAKSSGVIPAELLTLAGQVTDSNAAVFDASNRFRGCVPGINQVLFRQGLLPSIRCLNEDEVLSDGQLEEMDRVIRAYPHLVDDEFVRGHLDDWLR
jgi:dihydrodipicolinate synthase/N-acetylneuraminate lyase